jgi:rhamnopyranosyl-N-acetylglucosaminyl-diphospho-decaprenol beta-1,3/1,4-galactofuranosyltransferase
MDDDGTPDSQCLEMLLQKSQLLSAKKDQLVVCGAMCVQIDDTARLAFPSPLRGEFGEATREVQVLKNAMDEDRVLPGWASFMNGVLFPRAIVRKVGLPRSEMFICGDEVEYAKRIKAAGFELITVFDAVHYHPADRIEWHTILHPNFSVYTGQLNWKAFCFFRNCGVLAKNYGRGKGVTMLLRYALFYILWRRFDVRAWRFFLRAYTAGWRGDFSKKVPY